MSIYDRAQELTKRQLEDKGFKLTLRRRVAGTYNPQTGQSFTVTNEIVDVLKTDERDEQGNPTGRVRWIVYSPDFRPTTEDKLVLGTRIYDISQVRPLDPGNVVIFYRVFTDQIDE